MRTKNLTAVVLGISSLVAMNVACGVATSEQSTENVGTSSDAVIATVSQAGQDLATAVASTVALHEYAHSLANFQCRWMTADATYGSGGSSPATYQTLEQAIASMANRNQGSDPRNPKPWQKVYEIFLLAKEKLSAADFAALSNSLLAQFPLSDSTTSCNNMEASYLTYYGAGFSVAKKRMAVITLPDGSKQAVQYYTLQAGDGVNPLDGSYESAYTYLMDTFKNIGGCQTGVGTSLTSNVTCHGNVTKKWFTTGGGGSGGGSSTERAVKMEIEIDPIGAGLGLNATSQYRATPTAGYYFTASGTSYPATTKLSLKFAIEDGLARDNDPCVMFSVGANSAALVRSDGTVDNERWGVALATSAQGTVQPVSTSTIPSGKYCKP